MTDKMPMLFTYMPSPIGELLLAGDNETLHFLSFPGGHKAFGPNLGWQEEPAPFTETINQLNAYFSGDLKQFQLPLQPTGTIFQTKVWNTLSSIPFGQTKTYGWLANEVGSPKASRAVGAANGANPIPIIIPCHRVIGANGTLTGFGGGLPTKRFLLELEGVKVEGEQLSLL